MEWRLLVMGAASRRDADVSGTTTLILLLNSWIYETISDII